MRHVAIGGLITIAALLGACARSERVERDDVLATPDHAVTSPSGDHELRVADVDDGAGQGWRFRIVAPDGTTEYEADRTFSPRFRTYVLWDDADRVWVYSSDVGTYVWERGADGTWTGRAWRGSGLTAPEFLRTAVPGRFGD